MKQKNLEHVEGFQASLFFLLIFLFAPSEVQSSTHIHWETNKAVVAPARSTWGKDYQELQFWPTEIGLSDSTLSFESLNNEPPDQDGFLGRYTVLVKDITYLLPVGVLAIGAIYLMPEEASNWDHDIITIDEAWCNWKHNVTHWEWDKDDTWINLIGHPYFGSAYVVYARHYGYSKLESFWFSFAASLFYEVALEGWYEPVSRQDVILTPILGFCLAEILLSLEEQIKKNNNRLFNSAILGNLSLFLIDPFGHAIRPIKRWAGEINRFRDAEFYQSPIWQERSLFQDGNGGERMLKESCYGLILTVRF